MATRKSVPPTYGAAPPGGGVEAVAPAPRGRRHKSVKSDDNHAPEC
jgi:hypothetical protein